MLRQEVDLWRARASACDVAELDVGEAEMQYVRRGVSVHRHACWSPAPGSFTVRGEGYYCVETTRCSVAPVA